MCQWADGIEMDLKGADGCSDCVDIVQDWLQ